MNGAILVSQFLENQSWEKAVKELEKFWNDKDKGLASEISIDKLPDMNRWLKDGEWYKQSVTGAASNEAARRYNSVKYFKVNGAPKMFSPNPIRPDFKFFDSNNEWRFFYSNELLKDTILSFAKFPITTAFHKNHPKPRLLIFSVDVAEGKVVTFDSYPKADGSRKSEYGEYQKNKGYPHVIKYPGIMIEHVMASGTIPEMYDYAKVPMDQTSIQKNQEGTTLTDKSNKNKIRNFWDGGILSNTPLRELLQAHQEYWKYVEKNGKIPDLEVYIINVHPSKIHVDMIPVDYDGVKDRHNDIKYGDRTSHYDEYMMHRITDCINFASQLKNLVKEAINKVDDKDVRDKLWKRYEKVLSTKIIDKDREHEVREYNDLIRDGFKLIKVVRIEHTNYINSVFGKTADLTIQTINKLIKEGECDARISLIEDYLKCTQVPLSASNIRDNLINILNRATANLKSNNYENNTSVSVELIKFIDQVNKNEQSFDELRQGQSAKLIGLIETFRSSL
jgi:predicted acylesterase/phospholipase RssA